LGSFLYRHRTTLWLDQGKHGDLLDPLTIVDWAYEQTPGSRSVQGKELGIELPPVPRITVPTVATNEPTQTVTVTCLKKSPVFEVVTSRLSMAQRIIFTEVTAGLNIP
jgi:hypothetical protein